MTHQTAQMGAALAFFVAGGFCLSSIDAMGKLVISEISLLLLVWARYVGQVAISLPLSYRFAGKTFWKSSRPKLQLIRSILLASTTILFFSGVHQFAIARVLVLRAPINFAVIMDTVKKQKKSSINPSCCGQFLFILLNSKVYFSSKPKFYKFIKCRKLNIAMSIFNSGYKAFLCTNFIG